MSFLPDLTPLTNEIKVFSSLLKELNANSLRTHQLLFQILQELKKEKTN
jgi:hypothetical protein